MPAPQQHREELDQRVVQHGEAVDIDKMMRQGRIRYRRLRTNQELERIERERLMETPPSSGLALINRLPNELLTTIFAMRRDSDDGDSDKKSYGFVDKSMAWVYLMLVSRHWRTLGISSPWLWRRISVTKNMEALQYRLSRTVGCTIDVTFSNNPSTNECAMPLLLPFAPFIRSLETRHLDFRSRGLPSIQPLFQVPLRALEHVEVVVSDGGGAHFDLGLSGELHPRLRKLEIHGIVISPFPVWFSTLQELAINLKDLADSSLAAFTPECLVNILVQSPRLVSLKLYFSHTWSHYYPLELSLDSQDPVNLGPPIYTRRCRLPHLRTIDFHCPYLYAASVLTEVDAPAVTFFHLTVASRFRVEPSEIAHRLFPPSLRNIVNGKAELFIESMGEHSFGIRDSKPRPMIAWDQKDPCNRLSFHYFDLTETLDPLDAALSTLSTAFPSMSRPSLDIFGFTVPPSGTPHSTPWVQLFTEFPALRSLKMNNHPDVVASFLETFGALTTQSTNIPWPALRFLHIDTARCSCDGIMRPCGPLRSNDAHDFFRCVLRTVRARAERKVPLPEFRFEPSVRTWGAGVAAHRWILYNISLLCGEFKLQSEGHGWASRSRLRDLFSPAERRSLFDKNRDSEAATGTATGGTSVPAGLSAEKTTQPAPGLEEGGLKDTPGVPTSTIEDHNIDHIPAAILAASVRECECGLCEETLSIRSEVLQELLQTIPRLSQ